jgi:DNA-directed RNA polymerase specialized sigma24 family protein
VEFIGTPSCIRAGHVGVQSNPRGSAVVLVTVMLSRELSADFESFVLARSASLLRIAVLLTRNQQEAEDLLQTALLRTARRWQQARDQPDAYVRRVLINLAQDRGRAIGAHSSVGL